MATSAATSLHSILDLLLHLFKIKSLNLSFSLSYRFPSLPLMHLPPSTFFLSDFNPFTSLNVPFGYYYNAANACSAFYLIAIVTDFFTLFFMLLYLFLFSSVLFLHIPLCASFPLDVISFTSLFHHHEFSLLPLPFSSNTSHHLLLKPHP